MFYQRDHEFARKSVSLFSLFMLLFVWKFCHLETSPLGWFYTNTVTNTNQSHLYLGNRCSNWDICLSALPRATRFSSSKYNPSDVTSTVVDLIVFVTSWDAVLTYCSAHEIAEKAHNHLYLIDVIMICTTLNFFTLRDATSSQCVSLCKQHGDKLLFSVESKKHFFSKWHRGRFFARPMPRVSVCGPTDSLFLLFCNYGSKEINGPTWTRPRLFSFPIQRSTLIQTQSKEQWGHRRMKYSN